MKSKFSSEKPGKNRSFPAFRYAAVILAAGESKRLGFSKQLLKFRGSYFIEIALSLVESVDFISKKIVVLGAYFTDILKVVKFPSSVLKVYNPRYKEGLSSSVSLAVCCIKNCDAVLFLPVDQPFLRRETLLRFIRTYENGRWSIIAPAGGGLPALFSMKWRSELIKLKGDEGGRQIIRNHPEEVGRILVSQRELFDIDCLEDLESLKAFPEEEFKS